MISNACALSGSRYSGRLGEGALFDTPQFYLGQFIVNFAEMSCVSVWWVSRAHFPNWGGDFYFLPLVDSAHLINADLTKYDTPTIVFISLPTVRGLLGISCSQDSHALIPVEAIMICSSDEQKSPFVIRHGRAAGTDHFRRLVLWTDKRAKSSTGNVRKTDIHGSPRSGDLTGYWGVR